MLSRPTQGLLFKNRTIELLVHEKWPTDLILGCSFLTDSILTYNFHDKSVSIDFRVT